MTDYPRQETTPNTDEEIQQGVSGNGRSRLARIRSHAPGVDLLKAHVALMEREVITSRQGDLFRLVQHHYYHLQTWHDQHTGWRIQRTSTVIRLIRQLSALTPGYVYERLREPKDFACLTWILWYAENRQLSGRGNDQQFLLSQLADLIQEQSGQGGQPTLSGQSIPEASEEEPFDFRRPADRYSIQRALQYLENLGGLQLVDGQTREWVEQTGSADVLYEFTDVARSLVSALNPQVVADVAIRLQTPGARLQSTRLSSVNIPPFARAWRALLQGPALFRFDDAEAFAELLKHADNVADELLETFGWLLDIRRDYACIVRGSGSAGGPINLLTPYGTNDQISLLMCTVMRERITSGRWPAPDAYGCVQVAIEDIIELFYAARERYGENWGNEARSKSAQSLLNDVYRKMRQIGILRGPDEMGTVLILPLAARYSATYEKAEQETPLRTRSKLKARSAKQGANAVKLPGLE